jgi:UDP-glucose 4-epimerase
MIPPSNTAQHNVLLLGGTGFIGINLADALRCAGHTVIVTGRSDLGESIALPLTDTDALTALIRHHRISTVVHLASSMIPSSTSDDYAAEQQLIALPTRQIAVRLAKLGVRLVYVSSGGTVYGATRQVLVSENEPCKPISFYGQSKLEMESHLRFLSRVQGLRCLIVRPSNPFGIHQSLYGAQGLISVILGKIRDGSSLDVWGDGSSVRDYIYIDDLTASLCDLITANISDTVVNLGSGVGHSLLDVVNIIQGVAQRPIKLNFKPARSADVPRLVLDTSRIRALGMYHSRPIHEGIRTYMDKLGL